MPARVDRVAVEAAAELVVDAARPSSRQGAARPRLASPPPRASEQLAARSARVRELGRAAEAAVLGVDSRCAGARAAVAEQLRGRAPRRRRSIARRPAASRSARARRPAATSSPRRFSTRVGDRCPRRIAEARHPVARRRAGSRCRRRRARPSGSRNTVSGQPPWPRHRLHGLHVDLRRCRAAPRGRP